MMGNWRFIVVVALCCVSLLAYSQETDLRATYDTDSMEAAQAISQAQAVVEANPKAALQTIEKALAADANCAWAYAVKGQALNRLGDITGSITAYQRCVTLDVRDTAIGAKAALNLGTLFAAMKKYDDAGYWFSLALLKDPHNQHDQLWRVYVNMAAMLDKQGKYMSAGFAGMLAMAANPDKVDENLGGKYFEKATDTDETMRLFFLDHPVPVPAARTHEEAPTRVELTGQAVHARIHQLLADAQGRYIVAIPERLNGYYLITLGDNEKAEVRFIPVEAAIVCGQFAQDKLYLLLGNPATFAYVDLQTGKTLAAMKLNDATPTSMAVFPAWGQVYYTVDGDVRGMNLNTGKSFKTGMPAEYVLAHPGQEYLYGYFSLADDDDAAPRHGFRPGMLGGAPAVKPNRKQASIVKYRVVRDGLLMAEMRMSTALYPGGLCLSPDGHWVATYGSTWMSPNAPPAIHANANNFGVEVFSAQDLNQPIGYFPELYYSQGMAFNPVTGQIAIASTDRGVKTSLLADPTNSPTFTVKCSGPVVWSGTGAYLAFSCSAGDLIVVHYKLTPEEVPLSTTWWKAITRPQLPGNGAPPILAVPVKGLDQYTVVDDKATVLQGMAKSITEGRTKRLLPWKSYTAYTLTGDLAETLADPVDALADGQKRGMLIFNLRQYLQAHPGSGIFPVKYYLAEALRQSGQLDEVEGYQLQVIRGDAGRTDLTCLALNSLATFYADANQDVRALSALSTALSLDRQNPQTLRQLIPLLQKAKADNLLHLLKNQLPTSVVPADMPVLPVVAADPKTYTGAELYEKVVGSVVLVKSVDGSGSGFCVAKPDIILTNSHVVGEQKVVTISLFTYQNGKAQLVETVNADVIYNAQLEDVAVLRLQHPRTTLTPLALVATTPKTGTKVFGIGSPGLGDHVLEQSISEGLLAARDRMIEDKPFLQTTAAINPGNSGGPLFDEHCQVIGMITLKANLENVGFAIPVERIRKLFN